MGRLSPWASRLESHNRLFFFQAEDGIRDSSVTGVQTCALPIYKRQRFLAGTANRNAIGNGCGGAQKTEERRVGEEGRSPGAPDHLKKKKKVMLFASLRVKEMHKMRQVRVLIKSVDTGEECTARR